MTNHVLLNNVVHKDLRIDRRHSERSGAATHAVVTFPTEYADIQREYPIFFRRDPEKNEYHSVALLGFEQGENLFLEDGGRWDAGYVPAIVERGPFLIGFQEQEIEGELRKEPVIHVDMDDPRVGENEGERVFLQHGGNTPYVDHIANVLRAIQEGIAASAPMFAAFEACELIEPVELTIDLHAEQQNVVTGLHTINREMLANLDGGALEKLNRAGFLPGAFLVATSLDNVQRLIDRKNRRILGRQKQAS